MTSDVSQTGASPGRPSGEAGHGGMADGNAEPSQRPCTWSSSTMSCRELSRRGGPGYELMSMTGYPTSTPKQALMTKGGQNDTLQSYRAPVPPGDSLREVASASPRYRITSVNGRQKLAHRTKHSLGARVSQVEPALEVTLPH